MEPFRHVTGIAAPFPRVNVDTDAIIPKQFLKTIERSGLAKGLFYDLRTNPDGTQRSDFVLDQPAYRQAAILVAGANFGCGSSREHAVWALLDAGIRVVIGTTFADIFYQNCFKNGLLPAKVSPDVLRTLMEAAEAGTTLAVDLPSQTITVGPESRFSFDIEPFRKQILLEGLDDIALTLKHQTAIDAFERQQRAERPWLWPVTQRP